MGAEPTGALPAPPSSRPVRLDEVAALRRETYTVHMLHTHLLHCWAVVAPDGTTVAGPSVATPAPGRATTVRQIFAGLIAAGWDGSAPVSVGTRGTGNILADAPVDVPVVGIAEPSRLRLAEDAIASVAKALIGDVTISTDASLPRGGGPAGLGYSITSDGPLGLNIVGATTCPVAGVDCTRTAELEAIRAGIGRAKCELGLFWAPAHLVIESDSAFALSYLVRTRAGRAPVRGDVCCDKVAARILELVEGTPTAFTRVWGHSGVAANEIADRASRLARRHAQYKLPAALTTELAAAMAEELTGELLAMPA